MRVFRAVLVAAVAAGVVALGGCEEQCALESPEVQGLPSSCTEVAGQPVSYPVRLCPTCNQTAATCVPDLSAVATSGEIYLDVKVEACVDSTSCAPGCAPGPLVCSFTAPATPDTYRIITFDGLTGQTVEADLLVVASGPESCALASAP